MSESCDAASGCCHCTSEQAPFPARRAAAAALAADGGGADDGEDDVGCEVPAAQQLLRAARRREKQPCGERCAEEFCGGLAASSSSSSSSTSCGSSTTAAPASSSDASATGDEDLYVAPQDTEDCPICYEAISAGCAAMRCSGKAGTHHYFHKECLGSWFTTCREKRETPTCPLCRGSVQVNIRRLAEFLKSKEATALPQAELSAIARFVLRARASLGLVSTEEDGVWADAFSEEEISYFSFVSLASAGAFWAGYSEDLADDLLFVALGPSELGAATIATCSYVAGFVSRLATDVADTIT
eukprot:TRINITY_DN27023_c0_g1_i1.p1 TRINITY_DN27023_c0_g1~~TRINITY_DN27023_c0_g1_i1.p1  ORF type:complete len:348 (-),score=85.50 TRINITY_DN27023_c0_g1_i1:39-938(-)